MFRATFWGVRGSIPVPGPETAAIGGNTSCVEVRCGDNLLIFDGGTGLRVLGSKLMRELPVTAHLFFSHVHWDHIQGFPFFAPAFVKGNTIHMYGGMNVCGTVESALAGQMENPNFPVKIGDLGSQLVFHDLVEGETVSIGDEITVSTASGNHPGGVFAYRVNYKGKSLMYATDTEHFDDHIDDRLLKLAQDVDVLIYDSQYTPEEYRGDHGGSKKGWGHSTFEYGVALAKAANVKQYVLYHHDPGQDDAAVHAKEKRAQAIFPNSIAAYEGLAIEVAT